MTNQYDRKPGPRVSVKDGLLVYPFYLAVPVEGVERAGVLARDDAYRPLADHRAHQICQTLGYPNRKPGSVAENLPTQLRDNGAELYRMVDAVVIPLEFSTGKKIKVAEALAWNAL